MASPLRPALYVTYFSVEADEAPTHFGGDAEPPATKNAQIGAFAYSRTMPEVSATAFLSSSSGSEAQV